MASAAATARRFLELHGLMRGLKTIAPHGAIGNGDALSGQLVHDPAQIEHGAGEVL
ncbi:MAG: hypothetical protein ACP5QR_08190 [Rhizomicrobium sp.]